MIKLVIFDIDGVLVSTRKLHEMAFIKSLHIHGINLTEEEHRIKYDGLPTKTKLNLLGITDENFYNKIFETKQKLTFEMSDGHIKSSNDVKEIFKYLMNMEIKTAICSNAISDFCKLVVNILQVHPDVLLSNEDVVNPKPSPEIYEKAMEIIGISPKETLIFEDSRFGITSAINSGANICVIQEPSFLTTDRVKKYISIYERR